MNKIITSKMGNSSMPDTKFTIQNDKNQSFSIYYLDNQDLYFSTYTNLEDTVFRIERDDFELYRSFYNLFCNLRTNKFFHNEQKDFNHDFHCKYLEWIEELKKLLYDEQTNTITFISNDLIVPDNPSRCSLSIREQNLSYELVFHKPKISKHSCFIRMNTNRSDYGPLITLFIILYQDLSVYHDCYQYSFDDYLDINKIKQLKRN